MRINIIRHSTTARNEQGLATGPGIDISLSPAGIRTIEELKARGIYPEEPGALYGSGLIRTVETLKIIYPDREVTQRPCLNERDHGIFEFMDKEEYDRYLLEHPGVAAKFDSDIDWAPENGESTRQVVERARKGFPELVDEFMAKGYDTVTICSHGAYIRDMLHAFNVPVFGELKSDTYLDNGKGLTLEVEKEGDSLKMKVVGLIGGERAEDVLIDYLKKSRELTSANR
ncbi:MAG: histidine phosphatase family protein [Erysipelotrichaceae bacterium]|nr:histidine phosphatase family protein [Erysipelotrichaceae bacterium]